MRPGHSLMDAMQTNKSEPALNLIAIGENMVNLAYDATPLSQIETVEQALYELAGTGKNPVFIDFRIT
jgi:hypothetical protein